MGAMFSTLIPIADPCCNEFKQQFKRMKEKEEQ